MIEQTTAHVDESGTRLPDGRRLYVVAAVLATRADHPAITDAVRSAQLNDRPWHYYDETSMRRLALAQVIASLPLHGALMVTTSSGAAGQERARTRLLAELWPTLQHREQVNQVVMETRGGGDKHDRRTLDRLRRSHQITADLRVDHLPKHTPLLQLADFVAGAYVSARHHDEPKPWEIVSTAHLVDVTVLDPR
ncbi:MAG TPA: DUF3800 domain-containing protein [Pseudonocardiaceae bacterium]|jgi:hypothetical protein|nr:DUF3800 domain-containing protein [Pseudonocardiaceae bacterium]